MARYANKILETIVSVLGPILMLYFTLNRVIASTLCIHTLKILCKTCTKVLQHFKAESLLQRKRLRLFLHMLLRLSVTCRLSVTFETLLNPSVDLEDVIWQICTLWGPTTHCVRRGP